MMTHSVVAAAARATEISEAMTAIAESRQRAKVTVDETGVVVRDVRDAGAELAAAVGRFRV
jgi:hypothetical protein